MSRLRTSRSPDLQRLIDDGYELSVVSGALVVSDVPYLDEQGRVRRGRFTIFLRMAGDVTASPRGHGLFFAGSPPCDAAGNELAIVAADPVGNLGAGLAADMILCTYPVGRDWGDYYEMVTTYAALLATPVGSIARAAPPPTAGPERPMDTGPFAYLDTASVRAGIGDLNARLAGGTVGIIGLGGTGSYVLDLVAKTPVAAIHLFDDDEFLQHNAFRAPGAAALEDLALRRAKVDHFAAVYSRMHRGIVPHATRVGPGNFDLLDTLDFAFVCTDDASAKRLLVEQLERRDLPFVDVGMGLVATDEGLIGTVRVTTSIPGGRGHVHARARIPMGDGAAANAYSTNIQVADLNALNAALAVIRWKKLLGFHADTRGELFSGYAVDGNEIINEDRRPDLLAAGAARPVSVGDGRPGI